MNDCRYAMQREKKSLEATVLREFRSSVVNNLKLILQTLCAFYLSSFLFSIDENITYSKKVSATIVHEENCSPTNPQP